MRADSEEDGSLYLGFGAILQGDALGVELATSAHASCLSMVASNTDLGAPPLFLRVDDW